MTLENCIKYLEEATDEADKKFWEERIKRKYPNALKPEPIEEKPKPKKAKKVKDGNN